MQAPQPRGPWNVTIAGYLYALDDDEGQETLSFHWHPESRSPVTTPHLHLGAGARVERAGLAGAHIPTGPIGLEDVLRLLITELGVRPLRPDWGAILRQTTRQLELWRTWPTTQASAE